MSTTAVVNYTGILKQYIYIDVWVVNKPTLKVWLFENIAWTKSNESIFFETSCHQIIWTIQIIQNYWMGYEQWACCVSHLFTRLYIIGDIQFQTVKTLSLKHPVDVNCDTNSMKLLMNRIVILQKWFWKVHVGTTTVGVHQMLPTIRKQKTRVTNKCKSYLSSKTK